MARDIDDWLESLGLSRYSELFTENEIDFGVLTELNEQDLKDLQIFLGHRKKLLKGIIHPFERGAKKTAKKFAKALLGLPQSTEIERSPLAASFDKLVA